MEDVLVDNSKVNLGIIHTALNLIPHDTISKDPTLFIGKLEYHSPWYPQ